MISEMREKDELRRNPCNIYGDLAESKRNLKQESKLLIKRRVYVVVNLLGSKR